MYIQPYELDELRFAYCYRVYLRFKTHRAKPQPALAELDLAFLKAIADRYGIHILEANSSATELLLLASLRPQESVAAFASKLKGNISKWLRETLAQTTPANLLSKGYFACTTGQTAALAVEQYLENQADHHGYGTRPRPPIYVGKYELRPADEARLKAAHAQTFLQHHLVLASWRRRGVFSDESGKAVAECWRRLLSDRPAAPLKVSFVPDHVHLALRVHPVVSPAALIVELMNAAQELMWAEFANSIVRAGAERLWQASAYLGSYGDLESPKIARYVRQWEERELN